MIHPAHLRALVVRPTLRYLARSVRALHCPASEVLVLGTIAQESDCGRYLRQIGGGPALGIAQVEPATHSDNWRNYLRFRDDDDPETNKIGDAMLAMVPPAAWARATLERSGDDRMERVPPDDLLASDLAYCVAHCRIKFYRAPGALPAPSDLAALGTYWDVHYNANPVHGTAADWVESYRALVRAEHELLG